MDGSVRQEEMAENVKHQIRENAHLRRGERAATIQLPKEPISVSAAVTGLRIAPSWPQTVDSEDNVHGIPTGTSNSGVGLRTVPGSPSLAQGEAPDCSVRNKATTALSQSDTVLFMFYLEHVLPFLFPFYNPPLLQGGRAWILEMMIHSPVVRQATLCQSSYFYSLTRELAMCHVVWETVLAKTRDAFDVLRRALQATDCASINEHLHGAVRILASIMQVQRFEVAVSSFDNCQAHLNAALTLFVQLLENSGSGELMHPAIKFNAVISRAGPSCWILPTDCVQVPSSEQAAFRFSSTLLVFDDIIASTVLQEQPRLLEYHDGLLHDVNGVGPVIDLEPVVGCSNWVLLHISDIAVLDAWKQQCKRDGNLNVIELVNRTTTIKDSLEALLAKVEADEYIRPKQRTCLLYMFAQEYGQHAQTVARQSPSVTRVWAHAALLYLHVVVSGWQPASADVHYHVSRIIEILTDRLSPPSLLRTMVWPFCVAGCLSNPAQEVQIRAMVNALQPSNIFGTVRKALEIMETVWQNRDDTNRDLATCFRSQGSLVLLV